MSRREAKRTSEVETEVYPSAHSNRREFLKITLGTVALAAVAPPSVVAGTTTDLTSLTLAEAAKLVRKKSISPVELTRACLDRIERLNPQLNAFITVTAEQALARAREAESEMKRGRWRGPLHGIPVAVKDNIDTAGVRTTAGSAVFADRVPAQDAEVVRRLKAAGAVLLGKLNTHEFAFGTTSVISHFGPVHNPWKLDHIAGGSSGGAGAAVAARLCFGAVGTDTGGSIRIPAVCCGLVGLKPTYGRVSQRGVIPLSWYLDHVGPLCRTVADAALLLQVLAGYDLQDPTSLEAPVPDYLAALRTRTAALRLGLPRAPFFQELDPEIETAVTRALGMLRPLTRSMTDIKLPSVPDFPIELVESFAYHESMLATKAHLYHKTTRATIESGRATSAAAYIRARQELDRIRQSVQSVFASVDLLITPTLAVPPDSIDAALRRAEVPGPPRELRNTQPFNRYGLPSLTLPCGFTQAGLPIGLQVTGPRLGESMVLALARAYEQATDWHLKRPA